MEDDNLQRQYLSRLNVAISYGIHGHIDKCVDICVSPKHDLLMTGLISVARVAS